MKVSLTSSSKLVGGKDLATCPGREGLEDAEADQLLDESNTTVGEQEVGATGMKRPVLVAVGEARGGVGPVSFAGVREDERPASFGVEARFGLERHQRNGRVGDGAVQLVRDRFWLRSPAAKVWLVPSMIWAILTE